MGGACAHPWLKLWEAAPQSPLLPPHQHGSSWGCGAKRDKGPFGAAGAGKESLSPPDAAWGHGDRVGVMGAGGGGCSVPSPRVGGQMSCTCIYIDIYIFRGISDPSMSGLSVPVPPGLSPPGSSSRHTVLVTSCPRPHSLLTSHLGWIIVTELFHIYFTRQPIGWGSWWPWGGGVARSLSPSPNPPGVCDAGWGCHWDFLQPLLPAEPPGCFPSPPRPPKHRAGADGV